MAETAVAPRTPAPARGPGPLGWAAQLVLYAAFAAFIGVFSTWPSYSPLAPDQALIRLSFSQPGQRIADCRTRSAEELAKLPPTMRAADDCPRERSPIRVRVEVDGETLLEDSFPPSGIHRDGAAHAYRRMPVTAGEHTIRVRVQDDARASGYTHEREARVTLEPGQVVLIDFAGARGGILIR